MTWGCHDDVLCERAGSDGPGVGWDHAYLLVRAAESSSILRCGHRGSHTLCERTIVALTTQGLDGLSDETLDHSE